MVKSYGPVQAIEQASLRVPAGQVLAVLGPNGTCLPSSVDIMISMAS
ncbi:hypothetical protein [Herbidospora cretacea]|nr:hypothetical protein [Herbidospora cretacea]